MKNKKTIILYILLTCVIWQLGVSISKIIGSSFYMGDFFSIVPVINRGAAFGFFNNSPYFLGALGVVIILCLFIYVWRNKNNLNPSSLLLISIFTSGILGNTIERLTCGYVSDFIKINLFSFPVFNVFDILITCSVFCYILFYFKKELPKEKKN